MASASDGWLARAEALVAARCSGLVHDDLLEVSEHVHRVAASQWLTTAEERVAALLHHAIDVGGLHPRHLVDEGFPESIVHIVAAVTPATGEPWADFIHRVSAASIGAIRVQLADLEDRRHVQRHEHVHWANLALQAVHLLGTSLL